MTKIEKSILRCFGHVERMSESRLSKSINKVDVSSNLGRGRPRRTYIDLISEVVQKGQVRNTRNRLWYECGRGERSL